jgi:translation initiation factor 5
MQNIGAGNADDAFYRYKMPKLVAKVEGRGNGIKTNIVNNVDIAKALARPPEYVLKYYGCELGAQTNFEAKTGTCIVNGSHDNKKLGEILEGFIKKYVQCYSCGNPETQVKVKKEDIKLKCKACGFVSDVDPRHKLNSYIIKNPPEDKLSKEEKRLKKAEEERMAGAENEKKKKEKKDKETSKEKKEKKEKKDKKKKDQDEGNGDAAEDSEDDVEEEEEDDGVVWMTDTSAEAAKKRAEEQLSAATAAMVTQGNIEAEAEAERKRVEKEAKRKGEEEEAKRKEEEEAAMLAKESAQRLALAEAEANNPVSQIRALVSKGCSSPSDVAAAVKALTVPGGLPGKVAVLFEAIFCAATAAERKLVELILENKALLAALGGDPAGQLAQLIALEYILTVAAPERGKETALVLKTLYDEDLAEDEIIVAWGDKSDAAKSLNVPLEAGKGIRKIAAPVLDWLQEDEDEEDEDE